MLRTAVILKICQGSTALGKAYTRAVQPRRRGAKAAAGPPGHNLGWLLDLNTVHHELDVEQGSEQDEVVLEAAKRVLFEGWVLKFEVVRISRGREPLKAPPSVSAPQNLLLVIVSNPPLSIALTDEYKIL